MHALYPEIKASERLKLLKEDKRLSYDIDTITKSLAEVQKDFIALQARLINDDCLLAEYQLLQKKSADKRFISPLFKEEIIRPYEALCEQFDILSEHASSFINKQELEQIENDVVAAAKSGKLNQMEFFPLYQQIHSHKVAEHRSILETEISKLKAHESEIKSSYHSRANFDFNLGPFGHKVCDHSTGYYWKYKQSQGGIYQKLYAWGGITTPIGVGLLLLAGTAITHLIDKIVTSLKVRSLNNQVASKQYDIDNRVNPNIDTLHGSIARNRDMQIRQGFFTLSKSRHHTDLTKLDDLQSSVKLELVK